MDTRGILNFRCWDLDGGQTHQWDSLQCAPSRGKGMSIPQEGTGERDSLGNEIFRGDIVNWAGVHYLVGYSKGSYALTQLDEQPAGNVKDVWLHDCELGELTVVGNSHDNSEFVVQCVHARAQRKLSAGRGT